MIADKHNRIETCFNAFDHGPRASIAGTDDLYACRQFVQIDVASGVVRVFDHDIVRACRDSAFAGCLDFHGHLPGSRGIIQFSFIRLRPYRRESGAFDVCADEYSHIDLLGLYLSIRVLYA